MNCLPGHSYITKFHAGLNKEYGNISSGKDMSKLVSLLLKEVQRSREREDFLQKNLQTALTSESGNLTTLCMQLKEENKRNLDVIAKLREDIDDLTLVNIAEQKTLNDQFDEKLKEKENFLNSKIKSLESEIQEEKKRHTEEVQKLRKELGVADTRQQHLEASLKQQLVDKNDQLRQTQNMLRELQYQQTTNSTKNQRPEKSPTPRVLYFNNTTALTNKDNQAKNFNYSYTSKNYEARASTPSINNVNSNNIYGKEYTPNCINLNDSYTARSSTPSIVNFPQNPRENVSDSKEINVGRSGLNVLNDRTKSLNNNIETDNSPIFRIPGKPATSRDIQFNNIPKDIQSKNSDSNNKSYEARPNTPSVNNNTFSNNIYVTPNYTSLNDNYTTRSSTPLVVNWPHNDYIQNNINDSRKNITTALGRNFINDQNRSVSRNGEAICGNLRESEAGNNVNRELNSSICSTSKNNRHAYEETIKDIEVDDGNTDKNMISSEIQVNNHPGAASHSVKYAPNTNVNTNYNGFDTNDASQELELTRRCNIQNYNDNKIQDKENHRNEASKSKYQPLAMHVKSGAIQSAPTTYSGSYSKRRVSVPPLKPCSLSSNNSDNINVQNKSTSLGNKKRKLYDPADLHYLDDYESTPRK